VYINLIRKII